MLYPSRDSGINYRGIRTAPYMIRFLDSLINPIVRITHKDQLVELLVTYDVSLIKKTIMGELSFNIGLKLRGSITWSICYAEGKSPFLLLKHTNIFITLFHQ